jgi:hypothetical protein
MTAVRGRTPTIVKMNWLDIWWHDDVVYGYKGPLMLSFTAFVVTFIATRTITRMIRAGKGPFHNIDDGGVHMHHSTPGILILILGAFMAVGAPPQTVWIYVSGVLVGIGASLVLDEFAMLFRLQDVYWSQEGQLSVNVVTLAAGCIGLAAVGISPIRPDGLTDASTVARIIATAWLGLHLVFVAITALKGKYPTALIGMFIGPITWFAAVRLARPTSPWARKWYSPEKLEHARARAAVFDAKWGPVRQHWDRFIGGKPTAPAVEQQPAA